MFEGLFRPMHLLVILVIVLIIFGPENSPSWVKGSGRALNPLKRPSPAMTKMIIKMLKV